MGEQRTRAGPLLISDVGWAYPSSGIGWPTVSSCGPATWSLRGYLLGDSSGSGDRGLGLSIILVSGNVSVFRTLDIGSKSRALSGAKIETARVEQALNLRLGC